MTDNSLTLEWFRVLVHLDLVLPMCDSAGASVWQVHLMIRPIPIGIDDFRELRERDYEYVDKTHLITEFIDRENVKVILLPRPRRFGKSLNLSTLKWFFEKRDEKVWHLFEGLHVATAGEKYLQHFQKYPVVHVNLKETKSENLEGLREAAQRAIRNMYEEHRGVLDGKLQGADLKDYQAILNAEASEVLYRWSLKNLTRYLHQVHSVRPIVLIDEYDAGIHAAHANGFYKEAIGFFGSLFLAGLKDNPHLERAVMTGILRVSRESIFSDLNSLGVYTLLERSFNNCFGFTDEEVSELLQRAGFSALKSGVQQYYNGYDFAGIEIYNPWSILSFLERNDGLLVPYWLGTSSNTLIKELLQHHAFKVQDDIRTLLEGGFIDKKIDTNVVFPELHSSPDALWNLLVFTGYLKATRPDPIPEGQSPLVYCLSIPNREVAEIYQSTFHAWLQQALASHGGDVDMLLKHLLNGDVLEFEEQLQAFASALPSYHDAKGVRGETFYQGMMIGLLASLQPAYEVRSNRESGHGRPDVLIKPRQTGKPGVILELKTARKGQRTLTQALNEGLEQLEKNDYAADLRAAGVQHIREMVIAFDGKVVKVLPKGAKRPKKKATKKAKGKSKGK